MRFIIPTFLIMSAIAWLGCVIELPASATNTSGVIQQISAKASASWRRTPNGWQRAENWSSNDGRTISPRVNHMHPLVLAALQLLLAIGALVVFAWSKKEKDETKSIIKLGVGARKWSF